MDLDELAPTGMGALGGSASDSRHPLVVAAVRVLGVLLHGSKYIPVIHPMMKPALNAGGYVLGTLNPTSTVINCDQSAKPPSLVAGTVLLFENAETMFNRPQLLIYSMSNFHKITLLWSFPLTWIYNVDHVRRGNIGELYT